MRVMYKKSRWPIYASSAALAMALVAFTLGSAPFTPALILAVPAIPIAITCVFLGAWRTSAVGFYWAIASLLAVPVSGAFHIRVDLALLVLGAVGLVLTAILYATYARTRSSATVQ
jgi:hypothetical protein